METEINDAFAAPYSVIQQRGWNLAAWERHKAEAEAPELVLFQFREPEPDVPAGLFR